MTGSINAIYFTSNGIIPIKVIENLKDISAEALKADFPTIFWTDISKFNGDSRKELLALGITIKDYHNVNHHLDTVIEKFVIQGHGGDITSYAIASDILRVAIAGAVADDHLFIYVDCNDIKFSKLGSELTTLVDRVKTNPWGLGFPINVLFRTASGAIDLAEKRNDRMIVKKSNNPHFFSQFMSRYIENVLKNAPSYIKTSDSSLKKKQADEISVFCSSFEISKDGRIRMAGVKTIADISEIDFSRYLTTQRDAALGNTWRECKTESEQDLDELALAYARNFNQKMLDDKLHVESDRSKLDSELPFGSMTSLSRLGLKAKHPFDEYKLSSVCKGADVTFVMREYPHTLFKIHNFGTDKEKYEDLIYNPLTREIKSFVRKKEDVLDAYKKVEQCIEPALEQTKMKSRMLRTPDFRNHPSIRAVLNH